MKSLLRNTAYKSGFPSSVKKFFIHIPILSNCKVTCEIMFFYMISLLCTAVPCAHVINTEGSVTSDVIPYTLATSTDVSTLIPTETENRSLSGRALLPTGKNKFFINQLNIPVHDEPALSKEASNLLENPNPIISIKDGYLRGFIMETISSRPFAAFQGIPFAQPPVNQLRFQPPQKNFPWTGIKDVIEPSPQCIQADYIKQYQVHGSEDCLYLSVFTPKIPKYSQKERLPVMVFIHGGGFFFGSSSIYGPAYLLDQDVVLVSVNYRLGALGFLSTGDEASPGNWGLKDQVLALRWVSENIASFGGDANSVTIFGESAGASSVQFHFMSQLSRGYFHRGVSQSGCATCFWSIDERAPETAKRFGSLLNCTGTSKEMISCLRSKDASQLASTHLYFLEWLMYPVVVFGPVVEPAHPGAFLSEHPEELYKQNKVAKVPWISGYNSDEGAINIAVLLLDNKTTLQLNNEWEKYGPVFLAMKNSSGSNNLETLKKVREYYLGDKEISFNNRKLAIDMFGDRYSVSCGLKAMRYHSIHTGQPVYAYHLSFNGKYSIVQLLGQNSQDWGASHLNDLVYQFNNTAYYPELKLEDEEYKLSQIMNNMWSNFATHGKPYLSNSGQIKDIWEPIDQSENLDSPLKFLDLTLNPKMIPDPFLERDRFWRDLELLD